ncbi:MAG: glycoside hydrolase [Gammaproteobacteria bacterium]|nr:glycoside hydrolase [Gammaproteobacteria bacterium]
MPDDARLKIVFCWHMHQPQYRDLISGEYYLPWTYLHAIKDYVDMAAHLEEVPGARAVVNFAPLLLEQIEDYTRQVKTFLADETPIRDALLSALANIALPSTSAQRQALILACMRANEARMIKRFPMFHRLVDLATWLMTQPEAVQYINDGFVTDLVTWYHLAWLGETVQRNDARVQRLIAKAAGFSLADRRELLAVIGELLSNVIPRYAALAKRGQVELSVTPYAHPISPLLLDFQCAHDAVPDAPLPKLAQYPGGEARARWHARAAIETFQRHFGFAPKGCWPSEGAVSSASLKILTEAGFNWAASGEGVLRNSLVHAGHADHGMKEAWLYGYYSVDNTGMNCFFRDDSLSDLIGFTYATWHADDAVNNLVHHLENIAQCCRNHPEHVVSIIMDGENAWEHYPNNGYHFLSALYRRLADHPQLELTTFSDCIKTLPGKPLHKLMAGSWVYGNLSTWIGEQDKNRGWEMLGDAKQAFDTAVPRLSGAQLAAAQQQLAVCEGSDWFWWFGGYNPETTVADFEKLFRRHLSNLYKLIGVPAPDYLSQVFTHGSGAPQHGGVMRPGQVTAEG